MNSFDDILENLAMLVCDQDGTLTTVNAFAAAAASRADRYGLNYLQKRALVTYKRMMRLSIDTFGESLPSTALLRFQENVVQYMTRLRPDTENMLEAAHHRGLRIEMISNAPRDWGRRITRETGLAGYFHRCYYSEDMNGHPKPDPALLVARVRAQNFSQGACGIMLGDRRQDVKFALAADHELRQRDGIAVLPVSFAGTAAAQMILGSPGHARPAANQNAVEGIVFDDMFHMAEVLASSGARRPQRHLARP